MATLEQNTLDVTLLEPRQKHPTIFARFDDLAEGESLTILNDHDPKPLYYQLLGERGDIFTWEYLEQGPQWWQVRITLRKSDEAGETLGEIAAKDLRKAQVFKKYGLDFCCGGKKTVQEACAEKGLDVTRVEQELALAGKERDTRPIPYNDWSLGFLADYIVNTHHSYVRKNLPDIRTYALKVMRVHGSRHPELASVYELVEQVYAELNAHMGVEEKALFPYIKALALIGQGGRMEEKLPFTAGTPIRRMELDHETVGNALASIRTLTNDYALPEDACASYSLLYRMLDEFEEDLHLHVHLENNILFPKTLELEEQLGL
ncbi:MAG: iron-sulfur cluster repair di-iron protein [Sphingobacteriales bacterium 50-39]|nr:iron-sulfur cluster repair di-iron protein [Sphingobacteriales bacterium]OJW56294.1 MAG: iron-sulfur cluster repair di-iron protein [Sphingobacteriales bacterium 50-39]